jgi:protoporphyrinogen oxidase
MMYGGAARRKPMMYGGMATTKKKKKMQYGGTANQMSAKVTGQQMPREERKSKNMEPAMGMPKMAGGGELKPPPNPGAAALPKKVRNKMGFMSYGGETRGDIQDRTKKKIQI